MTADTRRLLIDGVMDAVINSDPDQIIAQTLKRFSQSAELKPNGEARQSPLSMEVIFRENIPPRQ